VSAVLARQQLPCDARPPTPAVGPWPDRADWGPAGGPIAQERRPTAFLPRRICRRGGALRTTCDRPQWGPLMAVSPYKTPLMRLTKGGTRPLRRWHSTHHQSPAERTQPTSSATLCTEIKPEAPIERLQPPQGIALWAVVPGGTGVMDPPYADGSGNATGAAYHRGICPAPWRGVRFNRAKEFDFPCGPLRRAPADVRRFALGARPRQAPV
jgi:hypothetical protein